MCYVQNTINDGIDPPVHVVRILCLFDNIWCYARFLQLLYLHGTVEIFHLRVYNCSALITDAIERRGQETVVHRSGKSYLCDKRRSRNVSRCRKSSHECIPSRLCASLKFSWNLVPILRSNQTLNCLSLNLCERTWRKLILLLSILADWL